MNLLFAMSGGVPLAHVPAPLVTVYRRLPGRRHSGTILDSYHLLARRLIEHVGLVLLCQLPADPGK